MTAESLCDSLADAGKVRWAEFIVGRTSLGGPGVSRLCKSWGRCEPRPQRRQMAAGGNEEIEDTPGWVGLLLDVHEGEYSLLVYHHIRVRKILP